MASFKDNNGKEWIIALDAPLIREVRSTFEGLDLAGADGSAFEKMQADPCLLVDVLWVMCREQAAQAGVSDAQFGKALVGDTIHRATVAMLGGIADFFPQSKRTLVQAIAAKNSKLREVATKKALAKINDPALEAKIIENLEADMDAQIVRAMTRSSAATSSPASAESAPGA